MLVLEKLESFVIEFGVLNIRIIVVELFVISENFLKEMFFGENIKRFIIGNEFNIFLLFLFEVEEFKCNDDFEVVYFDEEISVIVLLFCEFESFENFEWRSYF